MAKRGTFLVFEGVDRSGKTTQTKRIVDLLNKKGLKTELLRFPDRTTTTGAIINNYLQSSVELDDHVIHLLFSANRWECSKNMLDKLNQGINLVVDRYAYSGVSYSASKDGVDFSWCKQPDRGLPQPDSVLFLDMDVEEAAKRGDFGEERYEKIDFQKQVRNNFKKIIDEETDKSLWKIINANQSMDELTKEVEKLCLEAIEGKKEEIKKLWH